MINSVCYFNKGNIGKPYGTLNDLVELFNTFNDGENAWLLCMQGNFVWRRPNADIILLNYDPFSGKKQIGAISSRIGQKFGTHSLKNSVKFVLKTSKGSSNSK